jgi:mono/diheme cytochrome c family protein
MRTSSIGIAAILLLAPAGARSGGRTAEGVPSRTAAVTSLAGPSWLRTLAITVDETKLGHMGGGGPAPVSARSVAFDEDVRRAVGLAGSNDAAARASLEAPVTVDGADIYRLECRSCHGPNGRGEPPEVGSIVGLVRALSPALLEQDMRAAGRPVRPDLARQLADEAEKSLAERLRDGGKRMPPFRYLKDAERAALVGYLKHLAGVQAAMPEQVEVVESPARLGELLVQGTCRICHDATGPGGGHMMMMMGRIPALASIPEQLSLEAVVHKVRRGWSGMAGMMRHRMSRMPVFSYLSDEEVAAAYLYLAYYPPKD